MKTGSVFDYSTGELYEWKAPFTTMSRGGRTKLGGIGSSARRHTNSWKEFAILNGVKIPVPRYLHEAWKKTATQAQIDELARQKQLLQDKTKTTLYALHAAEQIAITKQSHKASRRKH